VTHFRAGGRRRTGDAQQALKNHEGSEPYPDFSSSGTGRKVRGFISLALLAGYLTLPGADLARLAFSALEGAVCVLIDLGECTKTRFGVIGGSDPYLGMSRSTTTPGSEAFSPQRHHLRNPPGPHPGKKSWPAQCNNPLAKGSLRVFLA
jgi:hypothetical protein